MSALITVVVELYCISQLDWKCTKLRIKFYKASLASLINNVAPCFALVAEIDHSFLCL